MEWARTLRIDAPPSEELQHRVTAELSREGLAVRFDGSVKAKRTYVLLQGPDSIDPAEIDAVSVNARSFPEAIIALAIEPAPADALPYLLNALNGPGAPAGVYGCEAVDGLAIVEFSPARTSPALVTALADAELRRFSGHRRTELLSPLTADAYARIAADGLKSPEIAPDRILESLLGTADVE